MFFCLPMRIEQGPKNRRLPLVNAVLIAANLLAFWLVKPGGLERGPLGLIAYAFVHAGPVHLLINMWVLWVFGNPANRRVGNAWYLLIYMGTALAIGIIGRGVAGVNLVGASGAIFAVIAVCLMLIPAALIQVAYIAVFPLTVLVGLSARPKHWLYWLIRWDKFRIRAVWGLVLVPAMEIMALLWLGSKWTNLAHLLGLVCGVAAVLLLPERISMNRRPALGS